MRPFAQGLITEITGLLPPVLSGKPRGAKNAPRKLNRRATDKPITQARVRRWYERPTSFTDQLPWVDYIAQHQSFLLEDGRSVGALFEVTPVGCEARPEEQLAALHGIVKGALLHALPEEDPPWVVQCFVQPEPVRGELMQTLRDYSEPRARGTRFTQRFLENLDRHLARLERPEGYFYDDRAGCPWRAQVFRPRIALYRRLPSGWRSPQGVSADEELNLIGERFTESLHTAGVHCRRCWDTDLRDWMLRWFNPRPAIPGRDPQDLLTVLPQPRAKELPFSPDLAEGFVLGMPHSDAGSGTWWFDGLPHSVLTVQRLLDAPKIGHFSAERDNAGRTAAFFDLVPDGATLALTIVIEAQDTVHDYLQRLLKHAVGNSPDAGQTRKEVQTALDQLSDGNKLYPVNCAFYLRGQDLDDLRHRESRLNAQLMQAHLQPVTHEHDPIRLSAYTKNLPMNYDPALDRHTRWSKLTYADAAAAMLPVYGRSRGTGNPGLLLWNRGGEPLLCDPLNRSDRKKNAHNFLVGPTGSGKSSLLISGLSQQIAMKRPRIFIFDPVGSFDLFAQHLDREGLTVNRVTIAQASGVSLPPFLGALGLLDKPRSPKPSDQASDVKDQPWSPSDASENQAAYRDPLAEMELTARLMVTGGEQREEARTVRADRRLLQRAILGAAREARDAGRSHVLSEDLARVLRRLDNLSVPRHERADEMADCIEMYCEGFTGEVFNTPGAPWPAADVTILNAGVFAAKGFEDKLALSVIGFVNHINWLAEREKHQDRHTIFVIDECHLVFCHPVLPPYLVMASKVWGRRLAVWLWLATQNMKDMPGHAERILSMLEWWICLSMTDKEIQELEEFRKLTNEQRAMLSAARKEPGKYIEGVIMSDTLMALFRSIPPRLDLALAMTEKEERAERAQIGRELGCSDLEAAYEVARRMEASLD